MGLGRHLDDQGHRRVVTARCCVERAADLLDVVVADEWVSRAGARVRQSRRRRWWRREYGSRSKLSTYRPMWRPVVVAWLP